MDQKNWRPIEEGKWIPMDKALVAALPKTRKYTLLEAAFSYQLDLSSDDREILSYRAYARIWGWALSKTINFIKNTHGTKTETPKDTHNTVKFKFIKPTEKSKEHTGKKSQVIPKNTPNKHNKEDINIKPIRDRNRSLPAMSFAEYSNAVTIDEKTKTTIDYFLQKYRTHRKEEHPRLKKNQWEAVIKNLFVCFDEKTVEKFSLSIDDLQLMIDRYFETAFRPGCNYSIIHFNNDPIKLRRMYETVNKR